VIGVSLLGRLLAERARGQVEDRLVGGAAVAADEVPPRRQAVLDRDARELGVPGALGGVEDDADVHHDVDEQAVGGQEAAQVPALVVEPQRHGPSGLYDRSVVSGVPGGLVPAPPGGPEQEAEVVDVAVVLPVLDERAVVLGEATQVRASGPDGEHPELAAEEALAPVGPRLAGQVPAAAGRVERERVRVRGDEPGHLRLRGGPGPLRAGAVAVGHGDAGGVHEWQQSGLDVHAIAPGTQRVVRAPTWSWMVLVWVKEPMACLPSSRPSPLAL
jgi:hypothetical protein